MSTREPFEHLPPAVWAIFRSYHRRKGWLFLQSRAQWLAVVYAVLVLAGTHLDRWLRFESGGRLAGWGVAHAMMATLLAWTAFQSWRRSRPTTALAYEIESWLEKPQEHLVAAYELLTPASAALQDSPAMRRILTASAEQLARAVEEHPRPRDRWRPAALGTLGALAVLYGVLLAIPVYEFPLMLARFYRPLAALPHPSFTKIAIGAYPNPVGLGNDVTIPVRISGRLAKEAFLWLAPTAGARAPKPEKMLRVGPDTFLYTRYNARADFAFHVRAGDGETEEQRVRVVEQPRVERLTVTVDAPAYAELGPEVYENPLEVRALEGAHVTTRFACAQELRQAQAVVTGEDGAESRVPTPMSGGTGTWEVAELKQNLFFRIQLQNREGFENLDQDQRQLLCVKDKPPEIVIEGGQDVVSMFPTEERVFESSATDDLGLRDLTLSFFVNPDPDVPQEPRRVPVKTFTPPVKETRASVPVRLEELNVEPGDVVEMRLEGMDTHRSFGRSGRILIQVVSFDPGLEEQQRIQALRVLSSAFGELALTGPNAAAPGRLGLNDAALQRVQALGEKLGVEPLPLAGDSVPLLERLITEQDLTPFHGYKEDLRTALTLSALALLSDAHAARRPKLLGLLGTDLLPAEVQFRFHRNLLRALGAFRAELDRLAPDASDSASGAAKRADQLRVSLEKWMGYLADISRESRARDVAFAVFEGDVEAVNTAAYNLRAEKPESVMALREALNRLIARSRSTLEPLAGRLAGLRAQALDTVRSEMSDFVGSLPRQSGGRDRQRQVVQLLGRALDHDPASPPESKIGIFLLGRLLVEAGPPDAAGLTACKAWLTDASPFVRYTEALYLERNLQTLLGGIRANKAIGAWNRDYDTEQFLVEHRWFLKRIAPDAADESAAFTRRTAERDAFRKQVGAHLPPAAQAVPAAAARFLAAQATLRAELEAVAQQIATQASGSTVKERGRILAAYDEADRRGGFLLETVRLYLGVEGLAGESVPTAWTLGWTRALVCLEERLDHFREISRETIGLMRAFDGRDFDAKERDIFPSRLSLVVGAAKALEQACAELRPAAGGQGIGETFYATEARRLPIAGVVEQLERQASALAAASAMPTGEVRRIVGDILKANPELQNGLIVDHLRPGVDALRKQLSAMGAELKAGRAPAERPPRLAEMLQAARRQIGDLVADLQKLESDQTRDYAVPLQRIAERLRVLPVDPKQMEGQLALFAFTLTEAERQVEQLQRALTREAPPPASLMMRKSATLEDNALSAARRQFEGDIQGWKTVSAERLFDFVQKADAAGLRRAAFEWQVAAELSLSPVMLHAVKTILTGRGGKDVKERRHWLVQEFEASLRLPLPQRHKTQTKTYYDNLKGKFREYEHTR